MKTLRTDGIGAVNQIGLFGDARDGGPYTFDGTTTILGMVPSSGVYALTRNIYCTSITINSGKTIKTAGFKIFCTGTLTNNGSILCVGLGGSAGDSAAGGSGAAGFAATTEFMGSGFGGTGAFGSVGSSGGSSVYTMRSGTGAAGTGGVGGGTPAQGVGQGGSDAARTFLPMFPGYGWKANDAGVAGIRFGHFDPYRLPSGKAIGGGAGGGGGGRGGGPGAGGGAGGSGGGCLEIYAATIVANTGSVISVAGGPGGNGGISPTAAGGGGGGGGSGGYLLLYYNSGTFAANTTKASFGFGGAGGTGAVGFGDGAAGQNGVGGVLLKYNASLGIWES